MLYMPKAFRIFTAFLLLAGLLFPAGLLSAYASENVSANITDSSSNALFTPQVVASHGFENNQYHNWGVRGGKGTVSITNEAANSGASSLKMTDRTEDWHMARVETTAVMVPGAKYEAELYVRLAPGASPSSARLNMLARQPETEVTIAEKPVTDGEWVKLTGQYAYDEASTSAFVYVYVADSTASYYVDDFKLTMIAPPPVSTDLPVYTYNFDDATFQGWVQRGSGKLELAADSVVSAVYSLKSTGRTSNWNGPSLNVLSTLKKSASYEISAQVRLPDKQSGAAASTVRLTIESKAVSATGSSYPNVAQASISDKGWVSMKGTYSFTEDMEKLLLYVESSDATEPIQIDDVVIKTTQAAPDDQTGIQTGFENNTAQGWTPRIGEETLAVTTVTAKSGTHSLLVSGRANVYSGPKLDVFTKVHKGSKYHFSIWLKLAPGENPSELRLSLQRGYQGENKYDTIVGKTAVTADGWVELKGDYQLKNTADSLSVYIESEAGTPSFYMDDFALTFVPPLGIETGIPSLHTVLDPYFSMGTGTAVEPFEIEGLHGELLKKHFSSVVTGNEMKPDHIQPQEGRFTFTNADTIVDFAVANGMRVRGHTLVWHNQTPSWFFKDAAGLEMTDEADPVKRAENKALLLSRLETHIKTVVEHYGTKVYAYDVVNEVIDDAGGLRNSKWYQIAGEDFIKEAFRYARQYAPAGTKLYINDYNTEQPGKRQDLYQLVTRLLQAGVPVDGVGHQMHINVHAPSIRQIGETIELFGALGLDNQITELDMSVYSSSNERYDPVPQELLVKQGYRYKDLIAEFIRLKDYISSVTFWGMGDDNTWLKTFPVTRIDLPLLFDEQLQSKPAYWGIVDPSRLPVVTQSANSSAGTPVIDGQAELLWNVQKRVALESEQLSGAFQTMWDANALYVLAEVEDAAYSAEDKVELFTAGSHYTLKRSGQATEGISYQVKEITGGYRIEAASPMGGLTEGAKKSFDIRVTDYKTPASVVSWSDLTHSQNTDTSKYGALTMVKPLSTLQVKQGTPVIDGTEDEVWAYANELSTDVWVQGSFGSTAKTKLLWDSGRLYVYTVVTDALLSDASSNAHEQDSVEIFLDPNNGKTELYDADDAQYRINFKNAKSYNGAAAADKIQSAVRLTEDGYVIEAAIEIPAVPAGSVMGFDLQVNNDEDGNGTRDSVAIWNDSTGQSYRSSALFGAVQLAGAANPVSALSGPAAVPLNQSFQVAYGISQAADVVSQEVTITYDRGIVLYERAVPADSRTTIVAEKHNEAEGAIRFLIMHNGAANAINGAADILHLSFKTMGREGAAAIKAVQAKDSYPNGDTAVSDASGAELAVAAGAGNRHQLQDILAEASRAYDQAVTGTADGQYPEAAKSRLLAVIQHATVVFQNPHSTTEQTENEAALLTLALARFNSLRITASTGDLNGKDGFDIGDLGIISHLYQTGEGQPEWKELYDLNGDGAIGLYEVQFIVNRILHE
jgi:endo-1,4-beta-xylanase